MKKISLKDSSMKEDKPKDDEHGEVQDVEVEPTQHFQRIRDTLQIIPRTHHRWCIQGVTTCSKLDDICGHFVFISHIQPENILEAKGDSYWCLQCKKNSINLSAIKYDTLFLDPMIDQSLILNGSLGISWMSQKMLLGIKLG